MSETKEREDQEYDRAKKLYEEYFGDYDHPKGMIPFFVALKAAREEGRREERERWRNGIRGALDSYKLDGFETEDGGNLPLVDRFTTGNTIEEGERELDLLAEHIAMEVEESKWASGKDLKSSMR